MNFRERLIASLPVDRQMDAANALRGYSNNGKDAVEVLIWILADAQKRAVAEMRETVRAEVARLHQDKFWQRIFVSRLLGWIVAPAVGAAILAGGVVGGVAWLRGKERGYFRQWAENPKAATAFVGYSLELARRSNQSADSIRASALLMNLPGFVPRLDGDYLVIDVPSDSIAVEPQGTTTRIKVNRELAKAREALGDRFFDYLEAASQADPVHQPNPK
jgi:hypothetical protein